MNCHHGCDKPKCPTLRLKLILQIIDNIPMTKRTLTVQKLITDIREAMYHAELPPTMQETQQ